eukprot:782603-Prymnesium_polylepis.1
MRADVLPAEPLPSGAEERSGVESSSLWQSSSCLLRAWRARLQPRLARAATTPWWAVSMRSSRTFSAVLTRSSLKEPSCEGARAPRTRAEHTGRHSRRRRCVTEVHGGVGG